MKERGNVLNIFKKAQEAIENEDSSKLKELSDRTIHSSSIYQDAENISVAVVIYALSKIIERKDYRQYKDWNKFHKITKKSIEKIINALENDNEKEFSDNIKRIRSSIDKLSGKLKDYINEVFEKANISKASRIYEHGVSLEKTAKLLGISQYELQNYVGKTGISDVKFNKTLSAKQRIKLAERFFG